MLGRHFFIELLSQPQIFFFFTLAVLGLNSGLYACKAAALLNLASPWLGLCLSVKRPFDSLAHVKAKSTTLVSPLARQPC
jgi:hypothetical protein